MTQICTLRAANQRTRVTMLKYYRKIADNKLRTNRGFTLVEMIVSLGVFIVVVFVAVGALTAMSSASQKVQSMRIAMDNLNLTLETIARGMRVGTNYHCGQDGDLTQPQDCSTDGSSFIAFKNSRGQTIAFRLNNGLIEKSEDGGQVFVGITAPGINVQELRFYVGGSLAGDGKQPRVLFVLQGIAGVKTGLQARFNIQTTISQRLVDS